jgi:SPP1 gp7 family putative phage head morphogenesis protein
MPAPLPKGLRLGLVEPVDAIAAFQQRGLLAESFRWQDVFQEEHARAFTVAGVMRLDVLQVFRDELDTVIQSGGDLRSFAKSIQPRLVEKGFWGNVTVADPTTGETRVSRFDKRRLQLIYDVNTRQSYASGRWARIERNKATKPFILYRTMRDERVRASHRAWDGLVLPVESDFWKTHYPPNGWRCRCTAFAVDEKDIARLGNVSGLTIKREEPPVEWLTYVNPTTGETVPVPRGIDPGFAYNPGQQRDAALYDQALRKALAAQPLAAAVAVAQATQANLAMIVQANVRFGEFVRGVQSRALPPNSTFYVGAIKPAAVRAIEAGGMDLETAALGVRGADVLHALRPTKAEAGVAVDAGVYARLPELLALHATALVLEKAGGVLLYVVDIGMPDGRIAKVVMRLGQPVQMVRDGGARKATQVNIVRTVTVIDPQALTDTQTYKVVWGAL